MPNNSTHVVGGGALSLMTLADLIRSSATIHSIRGKYGYAMNQAIRKQFGTIYYNNKVVIYNEQSHILEIRMGIGTKTETAYKGMHSVRMAIYGVEGEIYNSLEDLYAEKTGKVADTEDMNDMKAAIRGRGGPALNREMSDRERERGNFKEVNKFTISYDTDPNAQLSGYVIPVASVDPNTGAYTYGDSGKIFYMEKAIDVNSFVRVQCSCSNYYFVHAWYNYASGAHLGQAPMSYPGRNQDSTTIMNVEKTPGMCKHLMMFTMLLLNGGILSKVGTKGFAFNLQDIRNRTNKIQVPRKLADEGDWGKHMQNLQRTLRNADKRHVAQYKNNDLSSKFKEFEKQEINKNSITFDKWMNSSKKATRDKYYSNNALNNFAKDVQNLEDYYGQNLKMVQNATTIKRVLDLFRHNK